MLAFTQEAVNQVTQRQIEYPEPAGQVQDHHVRFMSLNNRQRHRAILQRQSIPRRGLQLRLFECSLEQTRPLS